MSEFEYTIEFKDIKKLMDKLNAATNKEVITKSLEQSGQEIAGWIKDKRLSGPRPQYLKSGAYHPKWKYTATGLLKARITSSKAKETSDGYEVKIGTNLDYAPIHEFGGTITRNPRSSLRVQNRYSRGSKKGAFKKGTSWGRGFTFSAYNITIPARPFLRPALQDEGNQRMLLQDLLNKLKEAVDSK